jgi:uncharacterized protein YrrD
MTPARDLLGRVAVSAHNAALLGCLEDLLFDDQCRAVVALVVARPQPKAARMLVPFAAARFAADRQVVLDSPIHEVVVGHPGTKGAMQGRPVVTWAGRFVGTVADVYIDVNTGAVTGFQLVAPAPRYTRRRRVSVVLKTPAIVGDVVIIAPDDVVTRGAATRVH